MSLDTVGEVAETKAPVELAFGTHRMRALGMRADLRSGSLRLESDVNGKFTP
jgi:lipopolysaccharide export system protein LptC